MRRYSIKKNYGEMSQKSGIQKNTRGKEQTIRLKTAKDADTKRRIVMSLVGVCSSSLDPVRSNRSQAKPLR